MDPQRAKTMKKAKDTQKRSAMNGTLFYSVTVTPYSKRAASEYSDHDRLQAILNLNRTVFFES